MVANKIILANDQRHSSESKMSLLLFLLVLQHPSVRAQPECSVATDSVHFELVTGKVFTAPEDMLDSRPGTLMLTDCVDLCR